ncbi:WD40-repeat-containing domain protein [Russula earlei]|uniref:WD40-repeat-containing domain protein n=1 Tax=Russula earlei TaxID=71964 RepID=A0ACC0UMW5_9AGAM|nr:WD40-repeat-containing domain protein [Russula earlei]
MEGDIEGPWYRDNQTNPPFLLTTCFKNLRSLEYRFVSLFPWNLTSLPSHHYGRSENGWRELIETYAGSVVVGNAEELFLVWALQPGGRQRKQIRFNTEVPPITAVAWALSQGEDSLDALLVIAVSRMVCVYSVGKGKVVGFLRGHGGSISSIAVHPQTPSHICTTSSDQTARIYDLDRSPDPKFPQVNPFLVPGTGPSMAGAPHGIRSAEEEEWTKGLCIAILVGGRSGGHLAAVTCAAFHPTFPLIATGGMDRVVKIWRLHDYKGQILREDKPLFSSSLIHRSSVASIVWCVRRSDQVTSFPWSRQASSRYAPYSLRCHRFLGSQGVAKRATAPRGRRGTYCT